MSSHQRSAVLTLALLMQAAINTAAISNPERLLCVPHAAQTVLMNLPTPDPLMTDGAPRGNVTGRLRMAPAFLFGR